MVLIFLFQRFMELLLSIISLQWSQRKFVIKICTGTACYVRGANKLVEQFAEKLGIEVGGTTDDGLFSLETVRCVGACSLAPVVTVNDEDIFKRVTAKEIDDIIAKYK